MATAKKTETEKPTSSRRARVNAKAKAEKPKPSKAEALAADKIAAAKAAAKAAEDAKKAAKKEVEAAKKAAEAERFKAATQKSLDSAAQRINARFGKIIKLEGQSDDHRLSVACDLASAKDQCREAKIPFKEWCETSLKLPPKKEGGEPLQLSYETVRKLLPIGAKELENEGEGRLMLEDMREKNRAANKAHRDKKAAEKKEPKAVDPDKIRQQIDNLEDEQRERLLRTQAKVEGLKLVKDDGSDDEESSKQTPTERLQTGFKKLTAKKKIEFGDWVAAELGCEMVMLDEAEDEGMDEEAEEAA